MPRKSKSKSVAEEVTYDIERLIGHLPKSAIDASQAESYMVKWEGYVVGEATWETAKSLTETSKAAIDEYWMNQKANTATPAESENNKENNDDDVKMTPDDLAEHVANKIDAEKEQLSSEIVENAAVDNNNEPDEYVIEEILDTFPKSATKKEEVKKYVIKWEGYDRPEDITKEPAAEIESSAPAQVKLFWKKKSAQTKKKEAKNNKKEENNAQEPTQSPGKRRSGRVLKKIPEPAVKKLKISPKKKKNSSSEESTSPEAVTPSNESMSDIVSDLMARVKNLETRPNNDRQFLVSLSERDDIPRTVKNVINKHLNK